MSTTIRRLFNTWRGRGCLGLVALALVPVVLSGESQPPGALPLLGNPWIRVGLTIRARKVCAVGHSALRIVWEGSNRQVVTSDPWEVELPTAVQSTQGPTANGQDEEPTGTQRSGMRAQAPQSPIPNPQSPTPDLPVRLQAPRGGVTELYIENTDGTSLKGSYRGFLRVVQDDSGSGLEVINVLPLEDYLLGVVGREMPSDSPPEALKAQAIVARSYALAGRDKHGALGFDLCATQDCQVYGGVDAERPSVSAVVEATRGMVLACGGQPITGFYSANCGGQTAAPENVWSASVPAHRAVADWTDEAPRDLSEEAALRRFLLEPPPAYCQGSAGFRWRRRFSRADLEALLKPNLERSLGHGIENFAPLTVLKVEGRTPSGRARTLRIEAGGQAYRVSGEAIRGLFRPPAGASSGGASGFLFSGGLPSRTFAIDKAVGPDGLPTAFEIFGAGWGHGVGMCQWGAIGMARSGKTFQQILAHYYPGASLTSQGR